MKIGAAAFVVAGCVTYLVWSAASGSAEYYQTISEVRSQPAAGDVRVLGVVQDDVQKLDGGQEVRFTAADGGLTTLQTSWKRASRRPTPARA